jgi:hypothetical protein
MSDTNNVDMAVQLLHDCMIAFVTPLQMCMAALQHAPVQHNIVINHGLTLNVIASTRKYLHMQSFILIAI